MSTYETLGPLTPGDFLILEERANQAVALITYIRCRLAHG